MNPTNSVYVDPSYDILETIEKSYKEDPYYVYSDEGVESDFTDEEVKKYKIPETQFHPSTTAEDVKKCLSMVYQYQKVPGAIHEIVKVLCALAVYEFRHPHNYQKQLFKWAEDDVDLATADPATKAVQELRTKLKRVMKTEGVMHVINSAVDEVTDKKNNDPLDKKQNDQLTKSADSKTGEPSGTADFKATLKELEERYSSQTGDVASILDQIQKLPNSDETRVYIGAWAMFQMRCASKNSQSMTGYGKSEKFEKLISQLYPPGCNVTKLPPLDDKTYENIHSVMSRGEPNTTGVIIRMVAMYHLMLKAADVAGGAALTGLSLQVLGEHGLTLYAWTQQASELVKDRPVQMLLNLRKENYTSTSIYHIIRFYYKYIADANILNGLNEDMKNRIGPQQTSYYKYIARLLNERYFITIGRKGNEALLGALYAMVAQLGGSKTIDKYYIGDSEDYNFGQSLGRRAAEAYQKKRRGGRESKLLQSCKESEIKEEHTILRDEANVPEWT